MPAPPIRDRVLAVAAGILGFAVMAAVLVGFWAVQVAGVGRLTGWF